jgi:F0F1-type ATP synthase assembly protein I
MQGRRARRWLIALLMLHTLANAARAVLAWRQDAALDGLLELSTPRGYLAAFGALWALVFAACAWLVRAQRTVASRVTIGVAVAYQAALWINLLAFTRSDDVWARLAFLLGWSLVALLSLIIPALLLKSGNTAS